MKKKGSKPNNNQEVKKPPTTSLIPKRQRRLIIAPKPNYSLNLWGIMKNCIGKELSKIPMPVSYFSDFLFSERLSSVFLPSRENVL